MGFENLCTLPLTSELFAQALHPTEPILAVGLSGGHVQSFRLPPVAASTFDEEDSNTSVLSTGTNTIDTEWRTRRHKGSCRTLAYSGDGEVLYSAGTDGLLKAASSATGQVQSKILIPLDPSTSSVDPPTLIHALSPQTLLLATDSAALHIYDLRAPSTFMHSKPSQTHRPHEDYISSLTPLLPTEHSTSGFSKQWVTTGGTTLAVTDLRRGVLVKSEDQEEELLSSVFVGGLPSKPGRTKGEKILVGSSTGIVTLWERGVWDDQEERIIVDSGKGGGESLDSMVVIPESVDGSGTNVMVGMGNGAIRVVQLGINKVVGELRHDEVEAVVALGFDVGGRLISGGGSVVKVWEDGGGDDDADDDDDDSDEETAPTKRALGSDDDSDDSVDADSSDEEEEGRKRRKKRKRSKGKDIGNGILKFKGLE